MSKTKTYLLWALRIIAGLLFILASLGKVTNNPAVLEMFANWGYPQGFHLVIGVIELLGGILLFIPKTSFWAAIGLGVIMVGAIVTHLINDPFTEILRPIIFMLFLGGIAYLGRSKMNPAKIKD